MERDAGKDQSGKEITSRTDWSMFNVAALEHGNTQLGEMAAELLAECAMNIGAGTGPSSGKFVGHGVLLYGEDPHHDLALKAAPTVTCGVIKDGTEAVQVQFSDSMVHHAEIVAPKYGNPSPFGVEPEPGKLDFVVSPENINLPGLEIANHNISRPADPAGPKPIRPGSISVSEPIFKATHIQVGEKSSTRQLPFNY
jgi:hypothetical protein